VSTAVPQRHPNPGSSNHATLAAVNKILNGSSLSGIATSLSAAVTNLSSAHNTLLNNHAGMHNNQPRHMQGRQVPQQQGPTNTVNTINTVNNVNNTVNNVNTVNNLSSANVNNTANTVEVNVLKTTNTTPTNRETQVAPRVNEQQINDLIKSALQKGPLVTIFTISTKCVINFVAGITR
jgi:hypothetical protein